LIEARLAVRKAAENHAFRARRAKQYVAFSVAISGAAACNINPLPDLPVKVRLSSIQVNFRTDGRTRAQPLRVPLIWIEAYPHRESLYDLHVVARGILGRK
jgi:hypothetical protein